MWRGEDLVACVCVCVCVFLVSSNKILRIPNSNLAKYKFAKTPAQAGSIS